MTREEAKSLLPIMQAFAEGKSIQIRNITDDGWDDINEDRMSFCAKAEAYRIKPESKYRPFKTQEECWSEMHKHPDLGWIMAKNKKELVHIGRIFMSGHDNVMITLSIDGGRNFNSSYYFNHYTFTDGEPFGIKER